MRPVDPAISFLIILLIGIVAGLIFDRAWKPAWFSREHELRGMVTMALIGVAGAFVGYHLTMLLLGGPRLNAIVPYIGAMVGAAVILSLWRMLR